MDQNNNELIIKLEEYIEVLELEVSFFHSQKYFFVPTGIKNQIAFLKEEVCKTKLKQKEPNY